MYDSQEKAELAALDLADVIASKSPIAVQSSKVNLNYSRDHPVDDALDYAVSYQVLTSGYIAIGCAMAITTVNAVRPSVVHVTDSKGKICS